MACVANCPAIRGSCYTSLARRKSKPDPRLAKTEFTSPSVMPASQPTDSNPDFVPVHLLGSSPGSGAAPTSEQVLSIISKTTNFPFFSSNCCTKGVMKNCSRNTPKGRFKLCLQSWSIFQKKKLFNFLSKG